MTSSTVSQDNGKAIDSDPKIDSSTTNSSGVAKNTSEDNSKPKRNLRPRIAVLPKEVADQIAAGEVVQRPVSVVKELLENSLDAGATQIVVQFDGLSKLSITDNGKGIPKSDLALLCTRHATSKLASVDDFSQLDTFGFRGEALASTSMVSRLLTVVSRVKVGDYDDDDTSAASGVAYSQTYRGGKPLQNSPKPCARKVGTTITIEDLFYNVPHRQKAYQKKDSEEYSKIHAVVQDYAVHYPTVGFVCQRKLKKTKQQKLVVDCNTGQIPAVKALLQSRQKAAETKGNPQKIQEATKQILSHILGSNLSKHLLYMECGTENDNENKKTDDTKEENSLANKNNSEEKVAKGRYDFRYAAKVYFTSPTYHSDASNKKGNRSAPGKFIMFLNHRLVDLPPLKRALEDVYADLGNPNRNKSSSNTNLGKPVLVVNLSVPGCQVDVNVHPSKKQVALMHQEDLVRDLAQKLQERLEEDGQAFVQESVKIVVKNPYAKSGLNKRKRSSDEDESQPVMKGCRASCCGDENDSGNGETPSKKPQTDDKSTKASSAKKVAPNKLIRTNSAARAGAIEPFLVPTQTQSSSQSMTQDNESSEIADVASRTSARSALLMSSIVHVSTCPLSNPSAIPQVDLTKPGAFAEQLKLERCTCPTEPARRTVLVPNTIVRPKRVVPTPSKYTSISSLRKRVGKQQCPSTTQMIRTGFFMGVMSHQRSLVQCGESLVMINHLELAKELFYQLALARFGGGAKLAQLGSIGGNGGIHIQTLIAQALQCEDDLVLYHEKERELGSLEDENPDEIATNGVMNLSDLLNVNDSNNNLAQHVTARLVESAPMLDEYFSIRIEIPNQSENDADNIDNAILTGLPVLLDGHCPQPHALPIFLLRLATQVDWTREKHCFHGVCKELGNFYAMLPNQSSGELNPYVQHHLFPALSYLMLPSKNLEKNGFFTTLTKLSTLYKVFERC